MRKAAFASIAVLAVIAFSASNLLSQPAADVREEPATEELSRREAARKQHEQDVRKVMEQATESLRAEYIRLSELKAQSMSADELEQLERAVQEMQWLENQREFAPIIEQLEDVADRHSDSLTGVKAEVAIAVLRSGDDQRLRSIQRLLGAESPSSSSFGGFRNRRGATDVPDPSVPK